ncbi:MAG: hypothetical protein M3273_06405, partial [Actinomycetota bacterium]|nr:hypothetical protein [Actinomycetota bacterium]
RVVYVEDSDDYTSCYDPRTGSMTEDPTYGLSFARRELARLGFEAGWSYYDAHRDRWHGPLASKRESVFDGADVLLNLAAVNPVRDWAVGVPVRVFVDQDPVFTQIANMTKPGRKPLLDRHNAFATFAESFGSERCTVPDDGIAWRTTRQPVMAERWTATPPPTDGCFTSVLQWDSYPPQRFGDRVFGMKSMSFDDYLDLPSRTEAIFELAVGAPRDVRRGLHEKGWRTRDSQEVTRDVASYESYIRASKAELGIAKHGYVASRSGWFSERSVAYMVNGRPVVLQDTGFSEHLPVGEGVLAFTSLEEAEDAVRTASAAPSRHGRAAREIARQHFDGRRIVASLLEGAFEDAGAAAARG